MLPPSPVNDRGQGKAITPTPMPPDDAVGLQAGSTWRGNFFPPGREVAGQGELYAPARETVLVGQSRS